MRETPEANRFLAKARMLLEHATAMLGVGLNENAGRTAYRARLHAAQAFIFETTQKKFKSPKGVQTGFLRLTKDDPRCTADQRIFLSQKYNLKALADYETGPGSEISAPRGRFATEGGAPRCR